LARWNKPAGAARILIRLTMTEVFVDFSSVMGAQPDGRLITAGSLRVMASPSLLDQAAVPAIVGHRTLLWPRPFGSLLMPGITAACSSFTDLACQPAKSLP
jgi:hypothetical protein